MQLTGAGGHHYHSEVTMLTTAVVPLRLRSMTVLPSSESAKSNALFSACKTKFVNNMACKGDA